MQIIEIHTPVIRLDQFLKWAGIVQSGSEAKQCISAGAVLVDGAPETRRGRSLTDGSVVSVQDVGQFKCVYSETAAEP